MATKIRLARHGRKKKPFYHIVVADSRAPRDGRFIEKLGSYNPNTNPATIELNFDSAVDWIQKGAVATDTARAILSHEGALLKVHLNKGVAKGALTEEQAQSKFEAWKTEKSQQIESKVSSLQAAKEAKAKAAMEAETERRKSIQEKVDAKLNPADEVEVAEGETETAEVEAPEATESEEQVSAEESKEVAETEGQTEEAPAAEATEEVTENSAEENTEESTDSPEEEKEA